MTTTTAPAPIRTRGHTITTTVPSPIGPLTLARRDGDLVAVRMEDQRHLSGVEPDWVRDDDGFGDVAEQLRAYFAGERTTFDLATRIEGTPFQADVWEALRDIPFGQTISYAELACRVGRPAAVRAVGQANGRNPLAVVIPCHRVVAADGSLGGYGGGLDRKRWLLDHEGAHDTWSDRA
ncbi:MAG: methylated-DNA--[protein]-cysteine S-methyltransferase [Acidimicrobiales bacterium]|nr:methylated-DNA--[protein]-cysteine S-methyltransferase [Acidimicrobiales bacterium]